jgi:hypothetical protein
MCGVWFTRLERFMGLHCIFMDICNIVPPPSLEKMAKSSFYLMQTMITAQQ